MSLMSSIPLGPGKVMSMSTRSGLSFVTASSASPAVSASPQTIKSRSRLINVPRPLPHHRVVIDNQDAVAALRGHLFTGPLVPAVSRNYSSNKPRWPAGPISNDAPIVAARYFIICKPVPLFFRKVSVRPRPSSVIVRMHLSSNFAKRSKIFFAPPC